MMRATEGQPDIRLRFEDLVRSVEPPLRDEVWIIGASAEILPD